jgi:hypothetical protein
MNNQPTPETDFHCWTDSSGEELIAVCKAEFCRKLERERDDARAELYGIRLNLGEDAKGYTLADAVILLQNARNDHRAVDVEWREHNER